MVSADMKRLQYVQADEAELNALLEGRSTGMALPWSGGARQYRQNGFGVLLEERDYGRVRPCAIVAPRTEHRRLFSRLATLRSDFSPLTAWCHLFEPAQFEWVHEPALGADLHGLAGAWTGLVIAEAILLSDRPLNQLRLATCQATQSFAIARTFGLWDRADLDDTLEKHSASMRLVSGRDDRRARLEEQLRPIWESLLGFRAGRHTRASRRVIEALRVLDELRRDQSEAEASHIYRVFSDLPEADYIHDLVSLSPENRVRAFDRLVKACSDADAKDGQKRTELAFLAGYLATVVAGGSASLSLTAESAKSVPEITAWAYAIGGVGERTLWTSSFEGLGRLVARELERPFHINEMPLCDIALDEAAVLVDRDLSDPLVRLRIKQTRVATVSLLPGVNITVALKDASATDTRQPAATVQRRSADADILDLIATALWPRIEARLAARETSGAARSQSRRRKSSDSKLL